MITFVLQDTEYFLKKDGCFSQKILRMQRSCDMMDSVYCMLKTAKAGQNPDGSENGKPLENPSLFGNLKGGSGTII